VIFENFIADKSNKKGSRLGIDVREPNGAFVNWTQSITYLKKVSEQHFEKDRCVCPFVP